MSFFKNMFGNSKGKGPTVGETIQKLRETEDLLMKKQEFLEKKVKQELVVAKANGRKNKRPAIQALKKKKRYEKQLQEIDDALSTMRIQRETLEGANTFETILTTMKNAADAMKAAHKHMDINQIHDMLDDIVDQQDVAREVTGAVSHPVPFGQDVDEEELLKELEALEEEDIGKDLLTFNTPLGGELPQTTSAAPKELEVQPKEDPSDKDRSDSVVGVEIKQLEAMAL
ncbi:hypothetical protein WDU94_006716 [Cyamophila willieti]